jgi:EF-P beta-lysylation protein EpmB
MEIWRIRQKEGFNSIKAIAEFLNIDPVHLLNKKEFPLHVPKRLAEKMPKGCLDNPLARQFLPLLEELEEGGVKDPVGDQAAMKGSALLHKYEGRALLLATGACAMHCRYCFRQNFAYKSEVDKALFKIGQDPSIEEVILSGGDPLSLSDMALKEIFDRLEAIPHVKMIRFHTRFIIGIPERVTERFLELLKNCSKQIVFVVHINCIEELDEEIFSAIGAIQQLKIPVLTQSVLLKGVNDSVDALKKLFMALVQRGVIPYYLHQLDRVKGALHFEVPIQEGKNLMVALRNCMPGYAVPRYVQEIAGEKSKTII